MRENMGLGKQKAAVTYKAPFHGFALNPVDDWAFISWDECEVIGNIHDTELLERGRAE